jgi:hypothetical protein
MPLSYRPTQPPPPPPPPPPSLSGISQFVTRMEPPVDPNELDI